MVIRDITESDLGVSAMKLEEQLRRKLRQMERGRNMELVYVG